MMDNAASKTEVPRKRPLVFSSWNFTVRQYVLVTTLPEGNRFNVAENAGFYYSTYSMKQAELSSSIDTSRLFDETT